MSLFLLNFFHSFHIQVIQPLPRPSSFSFWLSIFILGFSLHPPALEQAIATETPYPIFRFALSFASWDIYQFINQNIYPLDQIAILLVNLTIFLSIFREPLIHFRHFSTFFRDSLRLIHYFSMKILPFYILIIDIVFLRLASCCFVSRNDSLDFGPFDDSQIESQEELDNEPPLIFIRGFLGAISTLLTILFSSFITFGILEVPLNNSSIFSGFPKVSLFFLFVMKILSVWSTFFGWDVVSWAFLAFSFLLGLLAIQHPFYQEKTNKAMVTLATFSFLGSLFTIAIQLFPGLASGFFLVKVLLIPLFIQVASNCLERKRLGMMVKTYKKPLNDHRRLFGLSFLLEPSLQEIPQEIWLNAAGKLTEDFFLFQRHLGYLKLKNGPMINVFRDKLEKNRSGLSISVRGSSKSSLELKNDLGQKNLLLLPDNYADLFTAPFLKRFFGQSNSLFKKHTKIPPKFNIRLAGIPIWFLLKSDRYFLKGFAYLSLAGCKFPRLKQSLFYKFLSSQFSLKSSQMTRAKSAQIDLNEILKYDNLIQETRTLILAYLKEIEKLYKTPKLEPKIIFMQCAKTFNLHKRISQSFLAIGKTFGSHWENQILLKNYYERLRGNSASFLAFICLDASNKIRNPSASSKHIKRMKTKKTRPENQVNQFFEKNVDKENWFLFGNHGWIQASVDPENGWKMRCVSCSKDTVNIFGQNLNKKRPEGSWSLDELIMPPPFSQIHHEFIENAVMNGEEISSKAKKELFGLHKNGFSMKIELKIAIFRSQCENLQFLALVKSKRSRPFFICDSFGEIQACSEEIQRLCQGTSSEKFANAFDMSPKLELVKAC